MKLPKRGKQPRVDYIRQAIAKEIKRRPTKSPRAKK
jgi:hypothetical protein